MARRHTTLSGLLRAELEAAGHEDALAEALRAARLGDPPEDAAAFERFVLDHVQDALIGRVHPATALELVERVVEISRARDAEVTPSSEAPERATVETPAEPASAQPSEGGDAVTVRPPAPAQAEAAYDDLASGAVHTRETPVWGTDRAAEDAPRLTVLVTEEEALIDLARASAAPGTEVLAPTTGAQLERALAGFSTGSLVFDAERPSVPLDKVVAALTEHGAARVVLWRISEEAHARLTAALPHAGGWTRLGPEIGAAEVVRRLSTR